MDCLPLSLKILASELSLNLVWCFLEEKSSIKTIDSTLDNINKSVNIIFHVVGN